MYLLYVDESGHLGTKHFVLAGVAVFERDIHWLTDSVNGIQRTYFPEISEPIHFHASVMRSDHHEPWKQLPSAKRHEVLDSLYNVIAEGRVTLFGEAISIQSLPPHEDAYQFAFESMVKRFDAFLVRHYKDSGEPQRGLVVIAASQLQQRIETLALRIRRSGTRWGQLYNLAEIPLFTLAANSRLLQLADACSNAIFARYERGISLHFDKLVPKFDSEDGVIHGLRHYCVDPSKCFCPACMSRRARPAVSMMVEVPPRPAPLH